MGHDSGRARPGIVVVRPDDADRANLSGDRLRTALPRLDSSLSERERDSRWAAGVVLAESDGGGEPSGGITLLYPQFKRIGDRYVQAELAALLDEGPPDGSSVGLVGGLHRLRGGAVVSTPRAGPGWCPLVDSLFASAVEAVRADGRRPVSLYVPLEQAEVLRSGSQPPSIECPAPSNARIVGLSKFESWADYAAAQPKPVRHTLRRDHRRMAERAVDLERPASFATLMGASDLIVQVKHRNGIEDFKSLTEMRLGQEYRDAFEDTASPEEFVAWVLRDDGGDLVGYCLAAVGQDEIALIEIGLSEESPTRRDDYLLLETYAPTCLAINLGIDSIDLGAGHLDPKISRGAVLEQRFHLAW